MAVRELRQQLGFVSNGRIESADEAAQLRAVPRKRPADEMRKAPPAAVKAVRKKRAIPDVESISSVLLFSEQVGKFSTLSDNGAEVIAAFIDGGCNAEK